MGHGTLVPDAGEVVVDQIMAEGRSGLVMVLRQLLRGVSVQSAGRHRVGSIADTAAGSTICPGKEFRCGSSFASAGSFVRRKPVGTIFLLSVCRRLCSDMAGAPAG
jgi:hypothetical protein